MIRLVPLHESLVNAVARFLAGQEESISSTLVVYPSRRLRVFLLDALGRCFSGAFFPPRLLTVDGFFKCLHARAVPGCEEASELEAALALDAALNNLFPAGTYGLAPGKDFLDRYPRLLQFMGVAEECLVEGASLGEIDRDVFSRYVELGEYHREYKDFLACLPRVIDGYAERLAHLNRASRGMMYSRVAAASDAGELRLPDGVERVVFMGLTALNRSEQRVLTRIFRDHPAELFMRTDAAALADPASPFALQKETVNLLGGGPDLFPGGEPEWNCFSGRVRLHPCGDGETMMAALHKELAAAVAACKTPADLLRIGVVIPDAGALVPFIQGVVSRFDMSAREVPFNITLGYPFARTPLFQLLDGMLNLARQREGDLFPAPLYLDLLRHPYVKLSGGGEEADTLLRLTLHRAESWIHRENRLRVSREEIELQAENSDAGGAAAREAVAAMHRRFLLSGTDDLDALCAGLEAGIRPLRDVPGYLFLKDTVDTALAALEELRGLIRDAGSGVLEGSLKARTQFIHNYLTHREIRFQGSPLKGIQVMGLLEFRGLSFDWVFVLDAVEGTLPRSRKQDPLLPRDVRAALGIRQHTDWEQLFAVDFFSLTAASQVDLFWSEDAGWAPAHRSRFIERMLLETEKQKGEPLPQVRFVPRFEPPRVKLSRMNKDETIHAKLSSMAFSPSVLETYLHCPLRFYFQRILGLDQRQRLEADPDAGELGGLLHQALFRLYGGEDPAIPDPGTIESRLQAILEEEYRRGGFDSDSGVGRMRLWMFQQRLADFVFGDVEQLRERGTRILGLEKEYCAEISVADLDHPVPLLGRCDRVEKEGNRVRVVDYKSGASFRAYTKEGIPGEAPELYNLPEEEYTGALESMAGNLKGFQLYTYMLMLHGRDGDPLDNLDAEYVFLRETEDKNRRAPVFKESLSPEERAEQIRRFRLHLDALLCDIFLRPDFIPIPDESNCKHCPFRTPCGNI
ncbi:MAG TPA: PD-(D/E)XK nuclease family protein [Candidatus Aminicenantes bacterium]|nr:PD-(D/E)XK nuclease family protein [Candidatus Aminicenantes bacterium]